MQYKLPTNRTVVHIESGLELHLMRVNVLSLLSLSLSIPSGTTASIDLSRCFNTEIKEAGMEYPLWQKSISIDCVTSKKSSKERVVGNETTKKRK